MIGGIIGAGVGAASSIFGSLGKNKMLKNYRKSIQQQMADNDNRANNLLNQDATQLADVQRLLNTTRENFARQNRNARAAQAVAGTSTEQVGKEKEAATMAMTDATSQIAANAQARKDRIEQETNARKNQLQSQLDSINSQMSSGWDIAGNALGAAGQGFAAGYGLVDKENNNQQA